MLPSLAWSTMWTRLALQSLSTAHATPAFLRPDSGTTAEMTYWCRMSQRDPFSSETLPLLMMAPIIRWVFPLFHCLLSGYQYHYLSIYCILYTYYIYSSSVDITILAFIVFFIHTISIHLQFMLLSFSYFTLYYCVRISKEVWKFEAFFERGEMSSFSLVTW